MTASENPSWAILHVEFEPDRTDHQSFADGADRLDALGALAALEPWAQGVETRDASTWTHREVPALAVYVAPDALEVAAGFVQAQAAELGLLVRTRSETHEGDDWRDVWKRHYRPQVFGAGGPRALLLRPSWIERRESDPKLEVVLDPGRAFGTGLHASTRLCLRALCEVDPLPTVERVIDLGCGSGVLVIAAARLLGAQDLLALDIDPEATATTAENAQGNGIDLQIRTAPVDALRGESPAQLVFANIRPSVLIPQAAVIADLIAPGGLAILSGILDEEADEVVAAYEALGQAVKVHAREDEWCALLVRGPQG